MKHPYYFLLLVCGLLLMSKRTVAQTSIPTYTDQEIKERLSQINSAVAHPRFTPAVRSYINTYTVKRRDRTELMLGRMTMYFPMFEKYLAEGNVPIDLKYLSVVESALNPLATSRSGAVGLWQFMPPTGKEQGLKINRTLDERRDPHKATKAAIKYLSKQYKRYNNWELALAAYNGGPGRVNRAIKRGRSKNFWRIQRYLPRETQNYVPAFIAATYIANFYQDHNLVPVYPEIDLQVTELLKVYDRISFYEIQQATGTPMHIIEALNPSYKKKYIPADRRGHNLVLPQQYMGNLLHHLGRPDSEVKRINSSPIPSPNAVDWSLDHDQGTHTIFQGETYPSIATHYGVKEVDLRMWNQQTGYYLTPGKELKIYVPKKVNNHRFLPLNPLPSGEFKALKVEGTIRPSTKQKANQATLKVERKMPQLKFLPSSSFKNEQYLFYLINKEETLFDIAQKFSGVSMQDILRLNGISDPNELKPGRKIKVKKK